MLKKKQQSLAVGIYTLGATVGAVVAIPTIVAITTHLPWRSIFLLDGAAGLLWVPAWWALYRDPVVTTAQKTSAGARQILRCPQMWQLLIARALTDPVWYFYLFWYPKYLFSARHLTVFQVAHLGWIVYLGGGLGTIAGGLLSGALIRRKLSPRRAYRASMGCSVVLVMLSPLVALAPIHLSILLASCIALAHMAWLVNLTAMLFELFPAEQLGKAAGFVAAGSALGGMVSSEVIGYCVQHGGYRPVFFLMAIMHPLAIAILWTAFRERSSGHYHPAMVEAQG